MDPLNDAFNAMRETLADWRSVDVAAVEFGHSRAAVLIVATLIAAVLIALMARSLRSKPSRTGLLVLPAALPVIRSSRWSMLRHFPLLLFLTGIPFFALALADPFTAFTHQEASYPGRRIAVMIDASTSMNQPFISSKLNEQGGATYFATVAAAEYFMKLRMQGPHRDLISLIEFGNEAYVVTPFTTDYENVLLSMRLISAPAEWERFPGSGHDHHPGHPPGHAAFRAFDFLDASGNLMVIFSDGQDTQTLINGRSIDRHHGGSAASQDSGVLHPHGLQQIARRPCARTRCGSKAVARTGGRFYPGADEKTILRAVHEIDDLAPGRIEMREYAVRAAADLRVYALIAVALWACRRRPEARRAAVPDFPVKTIVHSPHRRGRGWRLLGFAVLWGKARDASSREAEEQTAGSTTPA